MLAKVVYHVDGMVGLGRMKKTLHRRLQREELQFEISVFVIVHDRYYMSLKPWP